jgi:hypothetical protein
MKAQKGNTLQMPPMRGKAQTVCLRRTAQLVAIVDENPNENAHCGNANAVEKDS